LSFLTQDCKSVIIPSNLFIFDNKTTNIKVGLLTCSTILYNNSLFTLISSKLKSFDDGISGKIKLNKAGDRLDGNYDFWIVAKDNDTQSYEWKKEQQILE